MGRSFVGVLGVPKNHAVKADSEEQEEEDECLLDSDTDHVDMET